jgi:flagellar basal-body rod protein FlgC
MRLIIVYLMLVTLAPINVCALEDSLQKAIEVAAQANHIQSERIKVVAENLANESSTSDVPGGDPYRRKIIFVENKYDKNKKTNLLRVKKYDEDKSPFIMRYDPAHPAADANGYVKMPNIRKEIERSDASEAQRAYEANLGVIEMSRSMTQKSLDVIR